MTTDNTVAQKDTSGANQDTSKGKQETSDAKTYTEAEVLKIKSDALMTAGRSATALETREEAVKAREETQTNLDRAASEAEYERVRGNPTALDEYQQKQVIKKAEQGLADREAVFEKSKLEHQVTMDAANALNRENGIDALAVKYKVDVTVLKDLDLDLEHTKKVAKSMTTLSPEQLGEKPPVNPKLRDSGVTIGGGDNLSGLKPKEALKEIDRQIREKP